MAAWHAYRRAADAGDGAAAAGHLAEAMLDYHGDLRRLALHGTVDEVRAWPLPDQVTVLRLRTWMDARRLRAMSPHEVAAYAIGQGWARRRETAVEPVDIRVAGDFARMEMPGGGTPYRFVREGGAWKWDATPLLHSAAAGFAEMARHRGISPDTFSALLLAAGFGDALPPALRTPPFPRPGGAGGRGSSAVVEGWSWRPPPGYDEDRDLSDGALFVYGGPDGGLFVAAAGEGGGRVEARILRRLASAAAPAGPQAFRWSARPSAAPGEVAHEGTNGPARLAAGIRPLRRDGREVLTGWWHAEGDADAVHAASASLAASLLGHGEGIMEIPPIDPLRRAGEMAPPLDLPPSCVTETRRASLEAELARS
jgi:hypothetical protein